MNTSTASARGAAQRILVFGGLFSFHLLFILLPILGADRYCNDDLLRAFAGNYGWSENGRHLTNLLMRVLQFGASRLVDISPLPQLMAIAILSWTGVLVARRFAIESPLMAVLATLPLGAQPFFLENLSYKFDAPFMALALMLATLPVVAMRNGGKSWLLGTLTLLACLNLYQPAICVFLVFAILEAAVGDPDAGAPAARLRILAGRALQFAIASFLYQWAFTASLKGWIRQRGVLVDPSDQWPVVLENISIFRHFVAQAFEPRSMALFVVLTALAVAVPMVIGGYKAFSGRRQRGVWQTALLLAALPALPCLALLAVAGPMLLLEQPVLMPRVMLGVGALLCAVLIAMHAALRARPSMLGWQYALAGTWALAFAVAAASYGNASKAQDRYETRIAHTLGDDLAALRARHVVRNFLVAGSAGLTPVTARMARQFPLLDSLVLPYLRQDDFNTRNFLRQHVEDLPELREGAEAADAIVGQACSSAVLQVRAAYTLRLIGETALVEFSRHPAFDCPASPHDF